VNANLYPNMTVLTNYDQYSCFGPGCSTTNFVMGCCTMGYFTSMGGTCS
jgi:hypothetical protein